MLRSGFMLLFILFINEVSSSTLPPPDVPQGNPGRGSSKHGSGKNITDIATLSGGSPMNTTTPRGGSTMNTTTRSVGNNMSTITPSDDPTTRSFGNTTSATTPSDDPVDEEEDSFFSSGVITQTLVEAFSWIFTNFIKLIADRVERTNSTEEVYIGA